MWSLVLFSCLLIGRRRFGSDRQAVSSGARLAVLGSARGGKRAVLETEVWTMLPLTPLPPELSPTRRRLEPRFWFSPARELEELALGKGRAEAEMKRKTARVHSRPPRPLTRCHGACWQRRRWTHDRARPRTHRRLREHPPSRAVAPACDVVARSFGSVFGAMLFPRAA